MADNTVPRKKPRLDSVADAINWGPDDEFSEEVFAQVDMVASQVYSQTGEPSATRNSNNTGNKFQRHCSWTASSKDNLPPSSSNPKVVNTCPSICQLPRQKTAPVWSSTSILNGRNVVGSSLQEIEHQKRELKCLREEKLHFENKIKALQETLSKKDIEIQEAKQECILLNQQCAIEKRKRVSQENEVDRLRTELNFKSQELASEQWRATQHQQQHQSQIQTHLNVKPSNSGPSGLHAKRQLFKSPKLVNDSSGFPTFDSFAKRLPVKNTNAMDAPSKSHRSSSPYSEDVQDRVECNRCIDLRIPHTCGIENGPGLVDILLNETMDFWSARTTFFKNGGTGNCDTDKSKANDDSSAIEFHAVNDNWDADLRIALGQLLVDNYNANHLSSRQQPEIPEDLWIFKTFTGLYHDSADALLPFIESALKDDLIAISCEPTENGEDLPDNSTQASLVPEIVDVNSASPGDPNSSTTECDNKDIKPQATNESLQRAVTLLKVLKQLVCYSSLVRHRLIQGTSSPESADLQTTSCSPDRNSPLPGPSHVDDNTELRCNFSEPESSPCTIMQMLFSLCSMDCMKESKFGELLQMILEIFTEVATYCHVSALTNFFPIIRTGVIRNCTLLTASGSVFLQFLSLLCALCSSKCFIEATCDQEDFCLWIYLSDGWYIARDELTSTQILQIDEMMIKLLSRCMSSEDAQPPFLAANECHCPFEIISNVILYLHEQQNVYEKVGHLDNWSTLQDGIRLLYQIVHRDVHFCDHRAAVNIEMFAFLHCLSKLQKVYNLGPEAEALMEIWDIETDETSENEDA